MEGVKDFQSSSMGLIKSWLEIGGQSNPDSDEEIYDVPKRVTGLSNTTALRGIQCSKIKDKVLGKEQNAKKIENSYSRSINSTDSRNYVIFHDRKKRKMKSFSEMLTEVAASSFTEGIEGTSTPKKKRQRKKKVRTPSTERFNML